MPPQVVTVRNASKVAAALSNEKCQRILDYLGKHKDATETQLSKDLDIPLSTVHYNMKVLSEANLVMDDVYTYSAKGKEVTHYRLNKNPIVIVQEEDNRYADLLKAIMPATAIVAGAAVLWQVARNRTAQTFNDAALYAAESAPEGARIAADEAPVLMMKSAEAAPIAAQAPPDVLPYFLAGAILTFILSLVLLAVLQWWSNRQLGE